MVDVLGAITKQVREAAWGQGLRLRSEEEARKLAASILELLLEDESGAVSARSDQWRVRWKRKKNPVGGESIHYDSESAARYRIRQIETNRPARQGEIEWLELEHRSRVEITGGWETIERKTWPQRNGEQPG